MNLTGVNTVLKAVGVLILVMVAVEYLVFDLFLPPPVIIATVLIILSFAFKRFPRAIAIVSLALSVLIPIFAALGVMSGQMPSFILIFDVVVFGWLGWTAIRFLRNQT